MKRMLVVVIIASGAAWAAITAQASLCFGPCTASIVAEGMTLRLNGADQPFHTDEHRNFTLTIRNETNMDLQVRLTNFQVYENAGRRPRCPGAFTPAAAQKAGVPPQCESPTVTIAAQKSSRFVLAASQATVGERYKFDIVAAMPGHGGSPTVFDPELIIDNAQTIRKFKGTVTPQ